MKRILKALVAVFVFMLCFIQYIGPSSVQAADVLANGKYSISYDVMYDGSPAPPAWGNYFSKPASLDVKDGKHTITLTLGASHVITKFQTEVSGSYQDVRVISEDPANQTRLISFEIVGLTSPTNTQMVMSYGMTHQLQLEFDQNSLKVIELEQPELPEQPEPEQPGTEQPEPEQPGTEQPEPEQPGTEQPEPEQPGTEQPEPEQPGTEQPEIADGEYTIYYDILYEGQPAQASWVNYFTKPAKLFIQNGKPSVVLSVGASQVITSFQTELNGKYADAKVIKEDAATQTKEYQFDISGFTDKTNAKMVMSYGGVHTIQLAFDKGSIKAVTDTKPDPKPETPGETKPDTEKPDKTEGLADGEYSLPLSVLSVDSDTESAFSKYFAKEGMLKVANGKQQLFITQVTGLTTLGRVSMEVDGAETALTEVSRNEAEGTRVLKVEIAGIQKTFLASIEAIGAPHLYPVRFVFDLSDLDIDIDGDEDGGTAPITPPADNGNGNGTDDKDKQSFERDADKNGATDKKGSSVLNAKTSDGLNYLQVSMYGLILLLSGWYLVRRYQARGLEM
ncbi:NEAT domain-containing protein [Cytobacillus purgationiresistens]|uniref:Heme-binding NEAT domain protein n=1 Tax=Cytobacillus purgationiresistens TaxID=863449 RepID=A0ABU0AMN9_9BACI|nr:NEAT domain-containing protein [Cytobacillus purgationiresistens]MDQ0272532.1 heme-binding NEAT domain protein [Cytobacillus purgationiresistens]